MMTNTYLEPNLGDMSKKIDTSKESDLVQRLENIGLTQKEARVYVALLPHRDIGSSKLIRMTGLHGQFVYDALAKLEDRGLAKHVVQNGRKKFSANAPSRILSLVEEKRFAAQTVIQQLQSKFAGAHEQNVEVFQGDGAFVAHQMDLYDKQPENSSIDVIASSSERYEQIFRTEGQWDEFLRLLKKRNIKVRYIGEESQRPNLEGRTKTDIWDYRILPGHATGLMNTDIWHDNVTLNIYGNPVLCITITGKEIAEGYRQFFETLWNIAKK